MKKDRKRKRKINCGTHHSLLRTEQTVKHHLLVAIQVQTMQNVCYSATDYSYYNLTTSCSDEIHYNFTLYSPLQLWFVLNQENNTFIYNILVNLDNQCRCSATTAQLERLQITIKSWVMSKRCSWSWFFFFNSWSGTALGVAFCYWSIR